MGANAQTSVPAFTSGQVLTAAQVTQINTGIPVFVSSTERDAAFGGAGEKTLAEGQMAYLEDTNETQVYDGSAWAAVGGGKILQVVRTEKLDNFNTTSTSYVDVTGMSVTITPTATSSAILILATFTSVHYGSIDNLRGNYAITDSSNTVVGGLGLVIVGSTNLTGTSSREFWSSTNLLTYDEPATTSATTYKLRAKTENASTTVRVAGATSVAQMFAFEVSA